MSLHSTPPPASEEGRGGRLLGAPLLRDSYRFSRTWSQHIERERVKHPRSSLDCLVASGPRAAEGLADGGRQPRIAEIPR